MYDTQVSLIVMIRFKVFALKCSKCSEVFAVCSEVFASFRGVQISFKGETVSLLFHRFFQRCSGGRDGTGSLLCVRVLYSACVPEVFYVFRVPIFGCWCLTVGRALRRC